MTGSLQVKNGKYYMVLNSTENGKRKQKWISTGLPEKGNKRKAEQMLREKLTEEEKRNPVVCSDMTVADCVRRWLTRMRRRVDEVTYRSYQHTAETHILPYFDENRLKLCDCTVEVLQTYFDEKYRNGRKDGKGGLSSKTMRHHKGILGQALAECVKDGLIPSNPCQYVEMPRRERHEAHFYSAEQLQQLITALNGDPIQPLVKIAALYGLRRSDDDDKIRLNQRKPSKYKGLRRFGPEKNLQRINKFMKERPIFYKNLIQMKENIRFYLRCFYCITKVMILQFNSENRTELARNG
jgi:hypothetical protein